MNVTNCMADQFHGTRTEKIICLQRHGVIPRTDGNMYELRFGLVQREGTDT